MIDVCTLVLIYTQTLLACIPPQVCALSADGTKSLCQPDYSQITSCNAPPPPAYECKRPDGTSYTYQVPR